ncbi:MAG: HAMP domain-containing histidine kinase [Bdellovibrionales bacterium]|nr:HAMP domain-containing histidine kinase [Bdellovibrionales bacterium]
MNLKSQALLRETLIITAFEDLVSKSKPSDIVKTFSPGVAGTWSKLTEKLSHLTETEAKSRVLEEQSHLARQVAHDIRSPLSALNLVGKNLPEDFEGKDLILAASKRINRISEDLLEKSRGANTSFQPRLERILENSVPKPASVEELKRSIENLIVEKQACYPNISFLSNTCLDHSFSERKILNIDIVEIERTISNLLQNSIEATTNSRKPVVKVLLSNRGDNLRFDICDNGIGIPKDIISNLGKKPITAGKTKGNGLGLYHASQIAHKYKGNIAFLPIEVGSHIRFTLNSL